jgi:hypothetical protein
MNRNACPTTVVLRYPGVERYSISEEDLDVVERAVRDEDSHYPYL